MMPAAVSTCGANTTAGRSARIAATTSSIGAGANGAVSPSPWRRAFMTISSEGIDPASKIWLQRYEKNPLRITITFWPVANCRATASMA
jgi:hypothetical protein